MCVGIKNTADQDSNEFTQVRLPRVVPYDGVIRPYSSREALGQSFLATIHLQEQSTFDYETHYPNERYVAHLDIPTDQTCLLITTERLVLIDSEGLKTIWTVNLGNLTHVKPNVETVLIQVRQANLRQRVISCSEESTQKWLCKRIDEAMVFYNEHHRLTD